jgi:hypothetical protein
MHGFDDVADRGEVEIRIRGSSAEISEKVRELD